MTRRMHWGAHHLRAARSIRSPYRYFNAMATRAVDAPAGLAASALHLGQALNRLHGIVTAMAATRTAHAVWDGDLIKGHGRVKGESGALPDVAVSWASRTEAPAGKTSPEELLAAAHAACFSMALSAGLGRIQKPPEHLEVSAAVTFDKVGDGWKVTASAITVVGKVPGISAEEFEKAAQGAGQNCPISGALKGNVAVTVHAKLA